MTERPFSPWRLDWTPEHVQRFWDWWGSNPALSRRYFARRSGEAILDQIKTYVSLSGTVVDVGAGPGYIVEILVRQGVKTMAVDTSPRSLAALEERLRRFDSFVGSRVSTPNRIPIDDSKADAVLLLETVEHLDDEILQSTLSETHRILRPGGWLAVTTPNDEHLEELETICPHCGCIYHSYQHVRSWSPRSLKQYMDSAGFDETVCRPTLFSHLPARFRPLHRVGYRVMRTKLPHLLYVGRKRKTK